MSVRVCEQCPNEFEAIPGNKRFCSQPCFDKHRKAYGKKFSKRDKRQAVCKHCLNTFDYFFRNDRPVREFCGRSCASKFYIADGTFDGWRLAINPAPKKTRIKLNCTQCNSELLRIHTSKFQFCDTICRGIYFSQNPQNIGKYSKEKANAVTKKQQDTLAKNYPGITNAFELAQHRQISKPQIEIFEFLKQEYQHLNWEIEKFISESEIRCFTDIVCEEQKLIIEFYGDYWHCNPDDKRYNDPKFLHQKKQQTAEQIWADDLNRNSRLENIGYKVFIIWEKDMKFDWKNILKNVVSSCIL